MNKLREKVAQAVEKDNNNVHPRAKVLMPRWSSELDAGTKAGRGDPAARLGYMLVLAMSELSEAYYMIDNLKTHG